MLLHVTSFTRLYYEQQTLGCEEGFFVQG